ncbi:hypothetical protein I4U23_011031 [Adineta vaga]|nr:hypothetical protein I4U23_011031 [Adineta vaga]
MGKKSSKLAIKQSWTQVNEASNKIELQKASEIHIVENFVIVWLDANIDESSRDFQNSIKQLRKIINSIATFTDENQCIQFIRGIQVEKIFLIMSGSLGERIVSIIHELIQLDSVYVFCRQKSVHEQWAKHYHKIKGVFTDMNPICLRLKKDVQQTNNDLTSISIVSKSTTVNLDTLDPLFMYSKLIKEIILETKYDKKVPEEFIVFCRELYADNSDVEKDIEVFKGTYSSRKSIEWYTRESFIYPMLNRALRTLDIEIIDQMGFYIRDLLEQIKQIYLETNPKSLFIVWRGQGISIEDFKKLQASQGGLLTFNNFLSTSTERSVSLKFAERARENKEMRAILYQIKIDPSISRTSFANLHNIGSFQDEKEILFSMHTVFRIGEMEKISDDICQVHLTLTTDDDPQLRLLTDCMRREIKGGTNLHRLANLMYKMGKFDKAKEIYKKLLDMTSDHDHEEMAFLHNQLGSIDSENGALESALSHYKESLRLYSICLSSDNPRFSATYSNIGIIFQKQGQLSVALEYYQRALQIDLETPHPNQCKIATHYNNIGGVLKAQGKLAEALKNYEDSLKIRLAQYPPEHPSLAIAYNSLGGIHCSMKNYSSALSYYEKTREIRQKSLPPNHPSLAVTYSNIAMTLDDLHRSKEAIEYAEKAVNIAKANYGPDHPQTQTYERHLAKLRQKVGTH